MGKTTIFTVSDNPDVSNCEKVKNLLVQKGAVLEEINLTEQPEWRPLFFLLTKGGRTTPKIFFNDNYIGGAEEVELLEKDNKLDKLLKEIADAPTVKFPPSLRKPDNQEFIEIIPKTLRAKWQNEVEAMDKLLGGTPESPISSLLVTLETPEQIVVMCTAGPSKTIYQPGVAADKGCDISQNKPYCQIAIERHETLFVDDPTKLVGAEKNDLWLKFGYGHYIGAPWTVGELRGTVVAMEKTAGVLKPAAIKIIEAMRDTVQKDLQQYIEGNN